MLAFYVDFNVLQQYAIDRVDIHFNGYPQPDDPLIVGMHVLLYDETLEVEGRLNFDEQHKIWYAIVDLSTKRTALIN